MDHNLPLLIYLISTCSTIKFLLIASAVIIGVICVFQSMFALDAYRTDDDQYKAAIKGSGKKLKIAFALAMVSAFIPSKDTGMYMLAAYGVQELAQNERVQGVADKSMQVLEKAMSQYLEDKEKK